MTIFVVLAMVVGVLLLFVAALHVISLFFMRVISGAELLILLIVFTGIMGGAISGGALSMIALTLMWIIGLALPLIQYATNRHKLGRMMREDIRKYEEGLKRQPDVPYPHRKLGDIYYDRQQWDMAAKHYQAYLEVHEINAYCHQRLERSLLLQRRQEMGLITCPVCGSENQPGAVRCEKCGFYIKGTRELMDVLTTPDMMRLWRWLMLVFLVPGLVLALIGSPTWLTGLMMCLSVVATILYMYGRIGRSERGDEA